MFLMLYPEYSGYPQEGQGAQVGSQFPPREPNSTRRAEGAYQNDYQAGVGFPPASPPFRPAVYFQNWNGILTWNYWQEVFNPNEYRRLVRENTTQRVMLGRTGLRDRVDRRPIDVRNYALNTKSYTPGSFEANRPYGGG